MRTVGISPKVLAPALLTLAAGVFLYLTGEHDTGLSLILAAVGAGGVGYAAPAAPVKAPVAPSSDAALAPEVHEKLQQL